MWLNNLLAVRSYGCDNHLIEESFMCKLFIGASPDLWKATTRSLRIDGMVTSVRLEAYFWRVLEEIAARDSLTLPEMLS